MYIVGIVLSTSAQSLQVVYSAFCLQLLRLCRVRVELDVACLRNDVTSCFLYQQTSYSTSAKPLLALCGSRILL